MAETKSEFAVDSTKASSHEVSGQCLTSIMLNGRNYLPWSRAVTIALGGRSKLGHISGQIKAPDPKDPKFIEWQASDHSVMTWIFNSMEATIYEIFAYSESAFDLWTSLKEMYSQADNASRIFELQQEIARSKQSPNQPFTEHLGNLKKRWDELRQYRPTTQLVADYIKREEQDRIFQLLASIKPEYEDLKRQILMSPTLPSFTAVCSTIQREETRRRVMHFDSTSGSEQLEISANMVAANSKSQGENSGQFAKGKWKNRGPRAPYHCDHCSRDGHTKDRCWVLNPHLRPSKDKNSDARMAVQPNPNPANPMGFPSSFESFAQQFQQF